VTAVVAELVLLTLAMLTVMIVSAIASRVQHLTPVLVGKMLQFAFVAQGLRHLMPLQQY
jgi:hypothetical protein